MPQEQEVIRVWMKWNRRVVIEHVDSAEEAGI
jgi:hypothetical protein